MTRSLKHDTEEWKNARTRARTLRLQGLSSADISKDVGVPSSTVYGWVKDVVLSPHQKRELLSHPQPPGVFRSTKKPRGDRSKISAIVTGVLSRERKAQIAEAAILLRLALADLEVYGPLFDGSKDDWMVRCPSRKLASVQVKWTNTTGTYGLPVMKLTCSAGHTKRRRYIPGEFDFIVGYDRFTDSAYVYSEMEVAAHKAAVTIHPDHLERWDKLRNF